MIVAADAFGQKGEVIKSFPLNVKLSDLKDALLKANESYAKNTTKKNYGNHIQKGRRNGVTWEMPMEYGEDRDGDGKKSTIVEEQVVRGHAGGRNYRSATFNR